MKELAEIVAAFDEECLAGRPTALATVFAVDGSSYRRPGARMLVSTDGRTWGGVSGGCLERDVVRRALIAIDTGRPARCRYDTADDESIEPAAATGCGGTIEILVQPLDNDRPGPLPHFARVGRERCPITLCTLVRPSGTEVSTGECFVVGGGVPPFRMPRDLPDAARPTLIRTPAGDVLIERLSPPQRLVVFGAGPDVIPLAAMAKLLGWHVTVVASRLAGGLGGRLAATVDALLVADADDPTAGVVLDADAAVVVMTHNVHRDGLILSRLSGPFRYLGVLGPRHRTRKLLAGLPLGRVSGVGRGELHAPVGLDLGADSPDEIALSIVAEVQAAIRGATGRPLRDRHGPVHGRRPGEALINSDGSNPIADARPRGTSCPV